MASATDKPAYTLYYHVPLPGRGEYVRLVLEAAGVPYLDVAKTPGGSESQEAVMSQLAESFHLAPPFLEYRNEDETLTMSQTFVCCRFVAQRHGLLPLDAQDVLAAEALVLTALDLANEVHETHHPVATSLCYEDQKPEAIKAAHDFVHNRWPKFAKGMAKAVEAGQARSKSTGSSPFAFGGTLSVADLVVFQTLQGVAYAFPTAFEKHMTSLPVLQRLMKGVEQHPPIQAYLASDRRMPFSTNGVFRYYPELQNS